MATEPVSPLGPPDSQSSSEAQPGSYPRPVEEPQIIFPLQVCGEHRKYLQDLSDPDVLGQHLQELGVRARLNRRRSVKPSEAPKLLEIRHSIQESRIELRWVWVREWTVTAVGTDGVPVLQLRSEPAMSALVLDPEEGSGSFRIPALQPNTLGGLAEQLRLLRRAAGEVIELDRFEPVRLEPVIRKLLRSDRVRVLRWSVRVRGKGNLAGSGDPGLLRLVLWRFRNIQGRWLKCEWLPNGNHGGPVVTKLFAASDRLDLLEPCRRENLERVLAGLGTLTGQAVRIPELRQFVRKHSGNQAFRSAADRIDLHLEPHRRSVLDLREIFSRWRPASGVPDAAAALAQEHPEAFRIRFRVLCPETGEPSGVAGRAHEWDDPKEIPATVACDHHRGALEQHPRDAYVLGELLYLPPAPLPEHGLLHLLRLLLRRFLEAGQVERLVRALAPKLFTIFYVLTVLGTTWVAALLIRSYPEAKVLIFISFFACLVPLAALVELSLGRPIAGRALRMVLAIGETVSKLTSLVAELVIEGMKRLWRSLRTRRRRR